MTVAQPRVVSSLEYDFEPDGRGWQIRFQKVSELYTKVSLHWNGKAEPTYEILVNAASLKAFLDTAK